jgi:hypothetical protein
MNAKQNENDIQAKVLYDSDRKCCVCGDKSKRHIQIHHIDGNNENNEPDNLAVLCLDCHADTQLKGGFSRKLNPKVIKIYRNKWVEIVRSGRRIKRPQEEITNPLIFPIDQDPIQSFLKQFSEKGILPIGSTYFFAGYYYLSPGFPIIIVTSNKLTPDNGERLKSILKAYLLCTLGSIAPPGMLVTTTSDPSESLNSVGINGNHISVPRWFIAGLEEVGQLHITGEYDIYSNQILLTLAPAMIHTSLNYDLLHLKFDKIISGILGKYISL